ncbi:MAG: hypothetical protein LBR29_04450 [Methylobacteriaceae bacterium]|nr:hypothetical protein [Methylobacteriaceae bacterium]
MSKNQNDCANRSAGLKALVRAPFRWILAGFPKREEKITITDAADTSHSAEPVVWISAVFRNTALFKRLLAYPGMKWDEPEKLRLQVLIDASVAGDPLPENEIPRDFYGEYKDTRIKSLPDFFLVQGSFLCVSERVAVVLREFGLGGDLRPVNLWQGDKTTPVDGGPYHMVLVSARKCALIPEQSNLESSFKVESPSGVRWTIPGWVKDQDIALSPDALEGAALWRDPAAMAALFISDHLMQAFRKAKIRVNLEPKKCRIIKGENV